MPLSKQLVDNDTGEVVSHKTVQNNQDFVMTFRPAYKKLREIGYKDPKARVLLDFFLEQMDTENALIVSRQTIAEFLGWGTATVTRKIKVLRDEKCIDIKLTGSSSVYLVNANLAWTTYADKRRYAHFTANVFLSESEQQEQNGKESEDLKAEKRKRVYLDS